MHFHDHFSAQADAYARFRPRYPAELFAWLASIAPGTHLAWDCGTGSGQAAVALAAHFESVIASDPSAEQVAHAEPHDRVRYRVGVAESPPVEAQDADLVTCAQALHWIDHERFYPELARIVRPGGIFAAWGYGLAQITPAIDAVVHDYYERIIGPYWPPERCHLDHRYESLPFPCVAVAAPTFEMSMEWSLPDLLGYLDTWSATRRGQQQLGHSPLELIRSPLATAWGEAPQRTVTWPLFLRVGRPVPAG